MKVRTLRLPNPLMLPYVEQGDAAGPPLLFLHGFSGSLYAFEPVLARLPPTLHAFALTQRGHGDASKPDEGYTATLQNCLKLPARVWRAVMKGRIEGTATSGDLSGINAPALIVWGKQDSHFPRSDQDALLAALPQARLEVYEGVGHGPHAQGPERLASDIAAFILKAVPHS